MKTWVLALVLMMFFITFLIGIVVDDTRAAEQEWCVEHGYERSMWRQGWFFCVDGDGDLYEKAGP